MSETLPARADIVQLRRQAKDLVRSATTGDRDALRRFRSVDKSPSLAAAQLVIARDYGFSSWNHLRDAVATARAEAGALPSGPLFPMKHHRGRRVSGPGRFLAGARAAGWEPGPLPDVIIYTFSGAYAPLLADDERFERNRLLAPNNATMFMTVADEPRIAVTCLSPGATAMVSQVENQHELGGADRFVILNMAGAISPDVPVGSVLVTFSAVRDDGISQHYLPPDVYVDADPGLTSAVASAVRATGAHVVEGATWTVPTPFRATELEIAELAADGVGVTECETASLLAVAEALGVAATACLAVTSSLVDPSAPQTLAPTSPKELLDAVLNAVTHPTD